MWRSERVTSGSRRARRVRKPSGLRREPACACCDGHLTARGALPYVSSDMRSDSHIRRLDAWLRTAFLEHNTALEEAYFAAGVEFLDDPALAPHKQAVLREGAEVAGAIGGLPER